MTCKRFVTVCAANAMCLASAASADFKMPSIFADHMVLQQGIVVPVWGWASPGEEIHVTFGPHAATATAGPDGKWMAKLPALTASAEPQDLLVKGASGERTFHDVLVGEVWIASGQSNMEFNLAGVNNGPAEVAESAKYPTIRLCMVERKVAETPQDDAKITWAVCGPDTAGTFSAVAYFFGRELLKTRNVPIGLIHASWGGTPAESWTSTDALGKLDFMAGPLKTRKQQLAGFNEDAAKKLHAQAMAEWKKASQAAKAAGKEVPPQPVLDNPRENAWLPGGLFDGMIAPVIPYALRGAIWYQGESNAGQWSDYRRLMTTLISDWRSRWGEGDFPFLYVQLANYMAEQTEPYQTSGNWSLLRESQRQTLSVPKTGMASAIDIGDAIDIHPRNKQEVGRRLALAARAVAYGEDVVSSGPTYKSMAVEDGKLVLSFDNVGGGLKARGEKLKGFGIGGEDGQWVWADAEIRGNQVVLGSAEVPAPTAACYAWANNPIGNLSNAEGLPALPFAMDSNVHVRSTPLGADGKAHVFLRTGSEKPISVDVACSEGARIEQGASPVLVGRDVESEIVVSTAAMGKPVELTLQKAGGRKIVHWIRPGSVVAQRVAEAAIDGDLSDWPDSARMDDRALDKDDARFTPQVRVAWTDDGLLLGGVLPCDEPAAPADPKSFWEGDCIELFVDSASQGVSGWSETAHQFWFCPVKNAEGQWRLYAGEFKRNNAIPATIFDDARCQTAMTLGQGGFVFEIKVPASAIGEGLKAGGKWRAALAIQHAGRSTARPLMTSGWPLSKDGGLLNGTERWGLVEFAPASK